MVEPVVIGNASDFGFHAPPQDGGEPVVIGAVENAGTPQEAFVAAPKKAPAPVEVGVARWAQPPQPGQSLDIPAGPALRDDQRLDIPAGDVQPPAEMHRFRDLVFNADGTYSTEKTITVMDDRINGGRPTNIPTIYGGKRISDRQATDVIAFNKGIDPDTGRRLPSYDTVEAAETAAVARSKSLSVEISSPKRRATFDDFTNDVAETVARAPLAVAGVFAQMYEGGDASDVSYGKDWSDRVIEKLRQKQRDDQQLSDQYEPYMAPGGLAFDRATIRSLSQQAAFSVGTMGSAFLAGLAATPGGPIAQAGAAGAMAGVTAYRVETNNALRDLRDGVDSEAIRDRGYPLSDEEFAAMANSPDMREAAYQMGFQWSASGPAMDQVRARGLHEAGWEAFSDVLMFGAGKYIYKIASSEGVLKSLPRTLAAAGVSLTGELASETETQIGQGIATHKMGLTPDQQAPSFLSIQDQLAAFRAVAPTTLLLMGALGAAGAGGAAGVKRLQHARLKGAMDDAMDESLGSAEDQALSGMAPAQPEPVTIGMATDWEGKGAAESGLPTEEHVYQPQINVPPELVEGGSSTADRKSNAPAGVYQTLHDQLVASGQTPERASAQAELLTAALETAARERGITVDQVFKEANLSITGPQKAGEGVTLNQSLPSRWPTSKKVSPSINDVMLSDYAAMQQSPKQMEKAVDLLSAEPGMKAEGGVSARAEAAIAKMVENIDWIYRQIPEKIRRRSHQWYVGANKVADEMAKKYGIDNSQAAGMLAVLSPQKDWYMNASMAARVADVMSNQRDHKFDADMQAAAFRFLAKEYQPGEYGPNVAAYENVKGKTLNEVIETGTTEEVGLWIRAYDEAHNSQGYKILNPEGQIVDAAKTKAGAPANLGWTNFKDIGKAASIYLDGTPETISAALGTNHKVRNFYNNIFDPASGDYVTIDTHAASAALMRPVSESDVAVRALFGGPGTAITGITGTYPLMQEAYFRAAKLHGVLPREMQSATWDAVRTMFPNTFKAQKENKQAVDQLWADVDAGKMSAADARAAIKELTAGIKTPDWFRAKARKGRGQLFETGASDRSGARINFEVAPDPNDTEAVELWARLSAGEKQAVSMDVGWTIAAEAIAQYGKLTPVKGALRTQGGGYLDDAYNPSMSLRMDKSAPASKVVELAKKLGYALRQHSMAITSPSKIPGGFRMGAVHAVIGDADPGKLYNELRANVRAADGGYLINGHTTADGTMSILVADGSEEGIAQRVGAYLDNRAEVWADTIYVSWPERGADEYGLHGQEVDQGSGAESPLRRDSDTLRARADSLLRDRIAAALADRQAGIDAAGSRELAAEAGGLPVSGRVRGGARVLEQSRRQNTLDDRAVEGLPARVAVDGREVEFGPYLAARQAARKYVAEAGIDYRPPGRYVEVDPERATRIAQAFDAMPHAPDDPEVKAAYDALIRETVAQWQVIKKTGLRVDFIDGPDPYGNPRNAILDVVNNNHLWVFPTDAGFGGAASAHIDISGNPLLQIVEGETISGRPVRANDIFRIVHDYFGHVMEGIGFRARGEENAWQHHMAMFSPLAQKALTTETRGQNSWVNYGPHAAKNRTASGADTEYAPQKIGILPDWVMTEGRVVGNGARHYNQGRVFGSRLQDMLEGHKSASMPAGQWAAWIRANAAKHGVKNEEIEFTGVLDYLALGDQKRAVPKGELLSSVYGAMNSITDTDNGDNVPPRLDVRRGRWEQAPFTESELNMLANSFGDAAVEAGIANGSIVKERRVDDLYDDNGDIQKRVFISRHPDKTEAIDVDNDFTLFTTYGSASDDEIDRIVRNYAEGLHENSDANSKYSNWRPESIQRGDNYTELLIKSGMPLSAPFKSKHWGDHKNVLAHLRMDVVNGKAGEKILHIFEIQSDWAQMGRRKGFVSDYELSADEKSRLAALETKKTRDGIFSFSPAELKEFAELNKKETELAAKRSDAVPEGPFVKNTESWVSLAVKRAIRYAVDNGMHSVVFEGGKAVADIYNLKKRVDRIDYNAKTKNLAAYKDNRVVLYKADVEQSDLENHVGKAVAEKIMQNPMPGVDGTYLVTGEDLAIGGEGMVDFYDNIVPQITNKIIKKYGAKIEPIAISDDGQGWMSGDRAMEILGIENANWSALTQDMRDDIIQRARDKTAEMNGFVITPALSKAALGGLPLFQRAPTADVYGRINIGPDRAFYNIEMLKADDSTFIHETGHFYLELLADYVKRGVASDGQRQDLQTILDWLGASDADSITEEQHEKFARGYEAYLYEGRSPSDALRAAFERLSAWIRDVYRALSDLDVELNDDIRGVYNRILGGDAARGPALDSEIEAMVTDPDSVSAEEEMLATEETYLIDTPVRDRLRQDVAAKMYGNGAARKERKATLIMGGPATGKSTISHMVAEKNGSIIVDSDDAKAELPEYAGGSGANRVHRESKVIMAAVLEHALSLGDNVVIPVVGKTEDSIQQYVDMLKARGYAVDAQLVVVPADESIRRVVRRRKENGRHVPMSYLTGEVGAKPVDVFLQMKEKGVFSEGSKIYETSGEKGKPAELSREEAQQFAAREGSRFRRYAGLHERARKQVRDRARQAQGLVAYGQTRAPNPIVQYSVKLLDQVQPEMEVAGTDLEPFLDRINSEADAKALFAKVVKVNEGRVRDARRGHIPWAETEAMAQSLGMTADKLMTRRHGQAFNAEEFEAARAILDTATAELLASANKARGGSDADVIRFQQNMEKFVPLAEQVLGVRAEWGRLGAIMQKQASALAGVQGILDSMGGRATIEGKAELLSDLAARGLPPPKVRAAAVRLAKVRTIDKIVEAWLMGLLSGLKTHATNILSNQLTTLLSIPEHAIAAGVGKLHGGEKVYFEEILPRAVGIVQGAREGAALAAEAFKTEEGSGLFGQMDTAQRKAIGGKLGYYIRTPGRALSAEDEFFKAIGFRMELNAQATRQAINEGLTGSRIEPRVAAIVGGVDTIRGTLKPPALTAEQEILWRIHDAAVENARYQTFTTELGAAGKMITNFVNKYPVARFVVPFIRTPINIVKYAGARSPLAVAMPSVIKQLKAGGAQRDIAVGRILFGAGLTATVALMVMAGAITGGGPTDPKERRIWMRKYQPYSIKIGGTWYSYSRLEPLGMVLGVSADVATVAPQMSHEDLGEAYGAIHASVVKNLASKTFLQGITGAISAYYDPERYAKNWAQGFVASSVPTGVAQLARYMDGNLRRVDSMTDSIRARLPLESRTLLPKLDVFGQTMPVQPSFGPDIISPVYMGVDPHDPVVDEMLRVGFYPSYIGKTIGGVELSPEVHNEYMALAGQRAYSMLQTVISGENYKAAPLYVQQDIIRRVWDTSREVARAQLFVRHPDLFKATLQKKTEKYEPTVQ